MLHPILLSVLQRLDHLIAKWLFLRGRPYGIPLRVHYNGDICTRKTCELRHW